MDREDYELHRRGNLVLVQSTGPHYSPDQVEQLSQVAARLAERRKAATSGGTMLGGITRPRPRAGALSGTRAAMPGGGSMLGADTTGLDVTATVRMRQIPTSLVHLLDPQTTPLLSCTVANRRERKARIKITTRVEGFSADAIDSFEMEAQSARKHTQLPVFFLDRLAAVSETRAASVYLRVEDLDGAIEHEQTYRVVLLPRTTAYLEVPDGAGGSMDLTRYLGAWVTPNAPEIMALVREAAALAPGGSIVGYQAPTEEDLPAVVEAQVAAIYRALQARKLTYVNSVIAFSLAGEAFVQRIRLPREALATGSANCIDGVVLMASALEAASLNPAIVLIPGHAFLGYERIAYSGQWEFVETTMLGSAPFDEAQRVGRATAESFLSRGSSRLTILSIPKLRTEHAVFPME